MEDGAGHTASVADLSVIAAQAANANSLLVQNTLQMLNLIQVLQGAANAEHAAKAEHAGGAEHCKCSFNTFQSEGHTVMQLLNTREG
jgi:hypothetical protein